MVASDVFCLEIPTAGGAGLASCAARRPSGLAEEQVPGRGCPGVLARRRDAGAEAVVSAASFSPAGAAWIWSHVVRKGRSPRRSSRLW